MQFDLAIHDGTIVDGTGAPRFRANLGINDGKIVAISREAISGKERIDAEGLAVAPGFIDIHSHSDWILPLADRDEILAPLLLQGFTTLITGNCGFSPAPVTDVSIPIVDKNCGTLKERDFDYSWRSMAEFLSHLEKSQLSLNIGVLAGHGTLRHAVMGDSAEAPSEKEASELSALLDKSLREGALGFSSGLCYPPCVFAKNEELRMLLEVTARAGKPFAVHGRAYTWVSPFYKPVIIGTAHNIRSTRELLRMAEQTKVRLQLSHLIFVGRHTWRTHRKVLGEIQGAMDRGVDVALDAFPYTFGNTTIKAIYPEWFLDGLMENLSNAGKVKKLRREMSLIRWTVGLDFNNIYLLGGFCEELQQFEGMNFSEIARELGEPEFDTYVKATALSEGKARILIDTYSGEGKEETPLRAVLKHPMCSFETDTILTKSGKQNPASFGTAPRILGRYCRELELFPLEEAVRKMTSLPAERMGLTDVGKIAADHWADLVLFDPARVADTTSFKNPQSAPEGIGTVLISGKIAASGGRLSTKERFGRVIRR